MTAPTYRISTVTDFLQVPEDRRAVCLQEFAVWLGILATLPPGVVWKIPAEFEWIDDGEHTATIAVDGIDVISGRMAGFSP